MTNNAFDPTSIPSMGTHHVGETLKDLAAEVASNHSIVEVGTWLGGGTGWLAQGAARAEKAVQVHTFDQFEARPDEVRKASKGQIEMQIGTDTLPVVRDLLASFDGAITFHKGDLVSAEWNGGPIGLYVDDAAKTPTLFYHALATFAPHWVPGETVIVLLDYRFWETLKSWRGRRRFRVQQHVVEQHPQCFEEILSDVFAPLRMGAFRYTAPLPMAGVRRQAALRRFMDRLPG